MGFLSKIGLLFPFNFTQVSFVSDMEDIEEFKDGKYMDVEDYIGNMVIDNGWEDSLS